MIPDRNLKLQEEIRNNGESKYVNISKKFIEQNNNDKN